MKTDDQENTTMVFADVARLTHTTPGRAGETLVTIDGIDCAVPHTEEVKVVLAELPLPPRPPMSRLLAIATVLSMIDLPPPRRSITEQLERLDTNRLRGRALTLPPEPERCLHGVRRYATCRACERDQARARGGAGAEAMVRADTKRARRAAKLARTVVSGGIRGAG